MIETDIVIVGGGIAGIALAAMLPETARVVVLEKEDQLGYHSTGRSAANFSELLASPATLQLTELSRAFLCTPPDGFTDAPLLHAMPTLIVGTAEQGDQLRRLYDETGDRLPLSLFGQDEVAAAVPFLRAEYGQCGLFDPGSWELDVNALHTGLVRIVASRAINCTIQRGVELVGAERSADGWTVETTDGVVHASLIVDAAGAWSDDIARRCSVAPIGIAPLRRTALIVPVGEADDLTQLPLVVGADHSFYFKRDGGRLLMSAVDEVEDEAGDAQPEELDIAIAMDRLLTVTTLDVPRPYARWAGHRSFSADREMVIGIDPDQAGFFWLAGQGGTGVQTAIGAARVAASLLYPDAAPLPDEPRVDLAYFAPDRFRRQAD